MWINLWTKSKCTITRITWFTMKWVRINRAPAIRYLSFALTQPTFRLEHDCVRAFHGINQIGIIWIHTKIHQLRVVGFAYPFLEISFSKSVPNGFENGKKFHCFGAACVCAGEPKTQRCAKKYELSLFYFYFWFLAIFAVSLCTLYGRPCTERTYFFGPPCRNWVYFEYFSESDSCSFYLFAGIEISRANC